MTPQYFGTLSSHGRFDYQGIHRRKSYRWPNSAGLAVYLFKPKYRRWAVLTVPAPPTHSWQAQSSCVRSWFEHPAICVA